MQLLLGYWTRQLPKRKQACKANEECMIPLLLFFQDTDEVTGICLVAATEGHKDDSI